MLEFSCTFLDRPAVLEIPVCRSDVPSKSLRRNQQETHTGSTGLSGLRVGSLVRGRASVHGHEKLPGHVVVGRCHQQAAGAPVSVGQGGREADGGVLQSAPPQRLPTAGTVGRHHQTEDLLLTVSQPDQGAVHVSPLSPTPCLICRGFVFTPVTHLIARQQPVR